MKKLFLMFVLALVLISSCNGEDEEISASTAYIGGVSGVSLSFLEGTPLDEFVVSEDIPVKLLLRNEGEYDLDENSIEVRLWGVDMASFGLSSDYVSIDSSLRGVQKGLIEEGAEKIVDMGTMNYDGTVVTSLDVVLKSDVCYPYVTNSNLNLCMSSSAIENVEEEAACSVSGNKVVDGSVSSGPVQLTSLTEQFEGSNRLVFKFKVENSGEGNVYRPGSSCSDLVTASNQRLNEDIIHVTLPEDFLCFFSEGDESNEGDIKLGSDAEKTLTCYVEVENQGFSFEKNIDMSLEYKYIDTSSVDFTILES